MILDLELEQIKILIVMYQCGHIIEMKNNRGWIYSGNISYGFQEKYIKRLRKRGYLKYDESNNSYEFSAIGLDFLKNLSRSLI